VTENRFNEEERQEACWLVLCSDWPNFYLDQWAAGQECEERGLDPEEAFQNTLAKFLVEHSLSFEGLLDLFRDEAWELHDKLQNR